MYSLLYIVYVKKMTLQCLHEAYQKERPNMPWAFWKEHRDMPCSLCQGQQKEQIGRRKHRFFSNKEPKTSIFKQIKYTTVHNFLRSIYCTLTNFIAQDCNYFSCHYPFKIRKINNLQSWQSEANLLKQ